jgi:hypothetical protein
MFSDMGRDVPDEAHKKPLGVFGLVFVGALPHELRFSHLCKGTSGSVEECMVRFFADFRD